MTFQILPIDPAPYAHLFDASDRDLAANKAEWRTVTANPGFPCRVTLEDAPVGERVLLVNHASIIGRSPYSATHAVFLRPGHSAVTPPLGQIPKVLARRTLSVRALTASMDMVGAAVVAGEDLGAQLDRMFEDERVVEVHIHNAAPGCYAAKAVRA